ncbi:MAG TPA: hydrogenase maturation nickel metallochaperone HypA [bacterium]|nr:hydrogenase maturation nickel metallochaperone HypA [bacterium]
MHEFGIARDLLREIDSKLKSGEKPERIVIVIGKAAGIDRKYLEHSFKEHIFPERRWENVEIHFEEEEPALSCRTCGEKFTEIESISCPSCGGKNLDILSGNRVYVKSVSSKS